MFVFLKALCARLFTSAVQIVQRAQTVLRHLKRADALCLWLCAKVSYKEAFTQKTVCLLIM